MDPKPVQLSTVLSCSERFIKPCVDIMTKFSVNKIAFMRIRINICLPNLKFVASAVPEILRGSSLLSAYFTICVRLKLFEILVKFCNDSVIGRQEIRSNAVYWLKLEFLQKSGFRGIKWGTDPPNLAIELSLRCHMSDSRSKFEKIGQKLWSLYRGRNVCAGKHRETHKHTLE